MSLWTRCLRMRRRAGSRELGIGSSGLARIFSALALVSVVLLVANFVVGMLGGDFNAAAAKRRQTQRHVVELERQSRADRGQWAPELDDARQAAQEAEAAFRGPRRMMTLHMLLGSAAALVTVL